MSELNKWPWEKGNILVISIVSLVVLAGLSVAILSTSVSEKKLAGNEQEQGLANQAAEYAVTMGKKDLLEKWAVGMCECQSSTCSCPTNAPWVWLAAQFVNADPVDSAESWWNNFGTTVAKPNTQLFSAPQYIIIDLGCDAVANMMRFRIVGRGVGTKQESVAFSDVTFSMPFNQQNVSSGQTAPVDALVDGVVQTTFNMAKFTASGSFYKTKAQCQTKSSLAQCEMNCAGQVRVMAWTADGHCAPTYGAWADVGVPSTVKVTLSGAPHTITCQLQASLPPPPPPGGTGTQNPSDNGKHRGYAYGHTKQDNWQNGNSDNPGTTPP
jgi:Tfp pilus assembly protein PilX